MIATRQHLCTAEPIKLDPHRKHWWDSNASRRLAPPDRADIGFTGGNLSIVIGGQDGNQPQWQPGHSATFQISTAVGAEIPLPATLPLLAAALAALALIRRRAAAWSDGGKPPLQLAHASEPVLGRSRRAVGRRHAASLDTCIQTVGTKSKGSLAWLPNLAYVENWTFGDATGVNTVMQTARNCAVLMVLSDGHLACWVSLRWDSWSGGPTRSVGERPAAGSSLCAQGVGS
jgi:hypothetical protein